MRSLRIGDVTITSIIERDGPWRQPEDMFPAYDPDLGRRYLAEMDREVYDPASNRMVITYQTFVVRTPHHTILVDTCTGEDKGYPAPMDFPKQPWLDGFRAEGLKFEDIDYVFCTHLHIDHCGWNTVLRNGRWVPTFPKAKYIFHKREYAAWEEATSARRSTAWRCLAIQLRADRRGGPGSAGGRRLYAGRYGMADADAGPFAVPLLREHKLGRPARVGDRRHDAPRAAMPRTWVVDDLRLGRKGGRGIAAQVPERCGGHQHADPADPFPVADRRTRDGRWRAVPLLVRTVRETSMRTYHYDHIHLRSPDPDATARFFEAMFDAEVTRSIYPPGTLYPGQMRVTMKVGGQKVLIAPTHPHDPTATAPQFPYYGLEHIGLTVDDVDAACEELRAKGADVAIGPLTRDPGTRLAFIRGPEGIMVELVQSR